MFESFCLLTNKFERDIITLAKALRGYHHGGGCFPQIEGSKFLLLPSISRGGDLMYITLEQLLLLASFIVALLAFVQNHNSKKK